MLMLSCYTLSNAQMPRLYTMEHGLPTTRINSSRIGSDGVLWLIGEGSLSFFDGNQFHSIIEPGSELAKRMGNIYFMRQADEHTYFLGTGFGLYSFDTKTLKFEQIMLGEDEDNSDIPGYPIASLELDEENSILLVTTSGFGSYVLDAKTMKVDKEESARIDKAVGDRFVYTTYRDKKGDIWFSTSVEPLVRFDLKSKKNKAINIASDLRERLLRDCNIVCSRELPNHDLLFGAPGVGMLIYDRKSNTVREIAGNSPHLAPMGMIYTKLGDLFVATDNSGILQYNIDSETLTPVGWEVPGHDLTVSKVHNIIEDKDGNLIASNYHNGVLVVPSRVNKMTYLPVSKNDNGRNSSPVSCLLQAGDTHWIGSDGSGMFQTDKLEFRKIKRVSNGLKLQQMTSVVEDANGNVWSASYGGGVQMLSGDTWVTPDFVAPLSTYNVLSMVADKKTNKLYVCCNGQGLYEVDINARTITHIDIPEIANRWVYIAVIDSKRNLWVAFATGVCYFNLDSRKASRVDMNNLNNAQINAIATVDDDVYFGTTSGVAVFSHKTNTLAFSPINEKLPELTVMSIQPVGNDIWYGLTHSVSCVSKDGKSVANYNPSSGFYIGELHLRSCMLSSDGFVCFGGDNGVVAFSARKEMPEKMEVENVLITGLTIHGNRIVYSEDCEYLDCDIKYAEKIKLDYDQNTFKIDFGSTEYAHSDEVEYEYMLEGYEKIWHSTSINNASAYYASVPPGHYTFRVRAHYDYSDKYTEKTIDVVVLHPWYSTWWARLFYLLVIAGIAYYIWRVRKERADEKAKLSQLQHNEQIKEAKLRLFTSIAHELRTPLTMILSPLKQLKMSDTNTDHQSLYGVMQRNCERLLQIVKQITDIRKIDNGQLHLHFSQFDFVKYCNDIMESFSGIANAKHIQFTLFCDADELYMWADSIHFDKIIINVLSNAFKFTPADGKVLISAKRCPNNDGTFNNKRVKEYLYCSIYNSGSHINEADIDHIFERFYQGDSKSTVAGSGIGLNLCYELVKLHHGSISVQNINPDGVEFVVRVPLGNEHLTAEELSPRKTTDDPEIESNKNQIETLESAISTVQNIEQSNATETKRKRHLLIVDDDMEICEYMRSQLESEYNITVCFSGNSAWKQVLAVRPDVVVTDLVMPDGNGLELCRNIKQNPETSHIPVIMLTAENNEASHLSSVESGIDQFLSKPFNIVLLRSTLNQVLRVREDLMNKVHRTDINHDYTAVEIDSYEDKFFAKINECVRKNLDDSDYTVEALAREVGVSRVHLNRKMKEHYGISPNAFIRSVRLKQAAYLLVNNRVNISEVAYKVGFASHSYFSNNFHEYFGMTPTEFVAYYSDDVNEEQLKKLLE